MKSKKIILSIIAFMLCLSGFSQRKTTSEDWTVVLYIQPISAKMNYSYIVDENGKHIRDGALSLVAKNKTGELHVNYVNYKYSGNYNLNANYKKGILHGPMTLTANYKAYASGRGNQGSEDMTWSFQGNYSDGLPHGTFNIAYNGENKSSLTATYNKGVIVGNMKFSYIEDGYKKQTGNISLNDKGILHGISTIYGSKMEFVNGVLVNKTDDEKSTPPSLVVLARKYANGQITEKELYEQDILIKESSIDLKKHANAVIFGDEIINFERVIERWDFTTPNDKEYKKLEKVSFINDAGVDMLIDQRISGINGLEYKYNGESIPFCRIQEDGYVRFDRSLAKKIVKDPSRINDEDWGDVDVYLTPSQLEKIKSAVDAELIKNVSIDSIAKKFPYLAEFFSNDMKYHENLTSKQVKEDVEKFHRIYNVLLNHPTDSSLYISSARYNEDAAKRLEKIKLNATSSSEYVNKEFYQKARIVAGHSLPDSASQEQKIYWESLKKKYEESLKDEWNRNMTKLFQPALDYLITNRDATSIAYNESALQYFDAYQYKLYERIKPFCKIINCEIVEIRKNEIVLNLTKNISKKKGNIEYQVVWKYNTQERVNNTEEYRVPQNISIDIESIDINNAKIINQGQ